MPDDQIRYNPGVLGDAELIRSFVVRRESLELVLEAVRDNAVSEGVNRHMLIVGPRGSGKTMLVRRVAAEIRSNTAYGAHWFPLVLGEESYPVSTPGEFWLEALFHLADQTKEARWEQTFLDLRNEPDDARLRERALAQLLDFANGVGRRLLLVVENLNMLVAEQMDEQAAWDLRHTLMNERRVMLLGTATSRFDEITNAGRAWFEMFSIHDLRPLVPEECAVLWRAVTEKPLGPGPLRAVRILTGGNPRLLTVLASFAANRSFRELMEQLVHLIDDHTEYFKSHLDALPAKERKVLVALLEHWDPVGAAELARISRLKINETSTMLGRLVGRGAVEVAEQKGRKKLYQVAERLYNIYYLMRRRGQSAGRVRAAVGFMTVFYEGEELATTAGELAREACGLPPGTREDHYLAYAELLRRMRALASHIIERTPQEFFAAEDAPESIRRLPHDTALDRAAELRKAGQLAEAEEHYRRVLASDPQNPRAWSGLAGLLSESNRLSDAEEAAKRAVELRPEHAGALNVLAVILLRRGQPEQAVEAFRRASDAEPDEPVHWSNLGVALSLLERYAEAEQACRKAVELKPEDASLRGNLGLALAGLHQHKEALDEFKKSVDLQPELASARHNLGSALLQMGQTEDAERAFRKAIELDPKSDSTWNSLGGSLAKQGRRGEAREAYEKAVELAPEVRQHWRDLGHLLLDVAPPEEAERFWRTALERHPGLAGCAFHLLDLRLRQGAERAAVLREAEEWAERSRGYAAAMGGLARFVADSELSEGFEEAESWAREAVAKEPSWRAARSLAYVLAARGKWKEMLQASRPVLDAAATEESAQRSATDLLIRAAAGGHVREALDALAASKGAAALEPLAVGLRICAGETPLVAKEILEVGQDVAERIRKYETKRQ